MSAKGKISLNAVLPPAFEIPPYRLAAALNLVAHELRGTVGVAVAQRLQESGLGFARFLGDFYRQQAQAAALGPRSYSCITMIDNETVGILYEGSLAHLTFQRIPLGDIIGRNTFDRSSTKEPSTASSPRLQSEIVTLAN